MEETNKIIRVIRKLDPYYKNMNSNFSPSYLRGSMWYVGESLETWWESCAFQNLNSKLYDSNRTKLFAIIELMREYYRNAKHL